MKPVEKLVVCGVGLIGGSFAAALRQAGLVKEIVGVGRSRANLEIALQRGLIDRVEPWAEALQGAELVLVAAPVGQMDTIFAAMAPHLQAGTIVTDAGSTKRDVVAAIYRHFPQHLPHVVPAHPIAGAEKSGADAADVSLYQGRKVVVTPLPENTPDAVARVHEVWAACGAVLRQMSPQEHDQVFAAVSHLPHLLAFGLVHELATRPDAELYFDYAASGFRDFTRIAGSHPEMWRDICLANRHALLGELQAYQRQLSAFETALQAGDGAALEEAFALSSQRRSTWQPR